MDHQYPAGAAAYPLVMADILDRAVWVWQSLLDLIYPPRCPGCGRIGSTFCDACRAQVEYVLQPVCRRCGVPLLQEGLCQRCRTLPSSLDGILAVAVFADPIRQAIHALKYENNTTLARPLGKMMVDAWQRSSLPVTDLVVPVPLHTRRQAERGYNQSSLLARVVSRGLGLPVDDRTLVRLRATPPQVGLSRTERHHNVEGAFACLGPLHGKTVLVVDDVCTTGATLEACAVALRARGATGVWAFTLARAFGGPGHDDLAPGAPAAR
jgi:ComF family protein